MKLVTVEEMRSVEREADASGLSYEKMMENAGNNLAEIIYKEFEGKLPQKVLGLVGPGNNGGDTLVALERLAHLGWEVIAYLVRPRDESDPLVKRVVEAGGRVFQREEDEQFQNLERLVHECSILLDGVLGTGVRLPLKQDIADVLKKVGQECQMKAVKPFIVAIDCPSGIDCDTGEAAVECLPANLTITMAAVKQGMLSFPAANYVGDLRVASIGDLNHLKAWREIRRFVADKSYVRSVLPARPKAAHKGTFGTAFIVAGCVNYTGAALLAGEAAYRCGAGLVTLAVPIPLHTSLAGQFPEATWVLLPDEMGVIAASAVEVVLGNLERATALLVGPGLGLEQTTRLFIENLFGSGSGQERKGIGFLPFEEQRSGQQTNLPPCVIDADGLKLVARMKDWHKRIPVMSILTPHPGEMSILTGLPKEELMANRMASAEHFALQWGHVVIFKGAFTIVASPSGRTSVIPVASPALARAGTGDVLAGLVVGLRAQGVEAFESAVAGAWIHAQAGLQAERILGSSASVLAGDVLRAVPDIMSELYGS